MVQVIISESFRLITAPPLSLRIFTHNIRRALQFIGAKIIPKTLHIRNNDRCRIRTEITQIREVSVFRSPEKRSGEKIISVILRHGFFPARTVRAGCIGNIHSGYNIVGMAEGQCQVQNCHHHDTIAEQREAFPVNVDQYSDKHDE